jgi:hypothetical protein
MWYHDRLVQQSLLHWHLILLHAWWIPGWIGHYSEPFSYSHDAPQNHLLHQQGHVVTHFKIALITGPSMFEFLVLGVLIFGRVYAIVDAA